MKKKKIPQIKNWFKGFTLIEIMIVIAIIGILSSVVVVGTNSSKKRARDARRVTELKQIANALAIYIESNNGKYPDSLDALVPQYTAEVPKDPLTQQPYFYCANGTPAGTNDGTAFHLAAALEVYNQVYFDSDADLEEDECENLPNNPSFNGYSEACAGQQKCSGINCDGCLDFSNILAVNSADGGNGNNGNNPSGNLDLNGTTGLWHLKVYVYPYNNGIARISWSPPPGQGSLYNLYFVKATGEFYDSGTASWAVTENTIQSNPINNFVELHDLKPGSQYSVVVEARMNFAVVETSNTLKFTATTNCGNDACDPGETYAECSADCKTGVTDYPPTPPSGLGLDGSIPHKMKVYWSPGWDKEGRITYYVHTIGPLFDTVSGTWIQGEKRELAPTDPFTVEDLKSGENYIFYVEGVDSSGQTSESARVP